MLFVSLFVSSNCKYFSLQCSDQPPLKMESFEGFDFMTTYYEGGCNNHSVNPDGMQLSNSVSTQPLHHNQSGTTIPGGHFLGVRMIGMSYLDLDSRCIGLCQSHWLYDIATAFSMIFNVYHTFSKKARKSSSRMEKMGL